MTTSTATFQRLVDTFRDAAEARATAGHQARRLARTTRTDHRGTRRAARALATADQADHHVAQVAQLIDAAGGRVEWGRGRTVTVYDGHGRPRLTLAA